MFTDQIESMKRQFTDKYVVVDAAQPELARFRDIVGRVKTVNMSGRALVEFDDYHLNTGWYDIDLDFLKVVDKPPPKPPKAEVKKPAAKPAAVAKPQVAAKPVAPAAAGKQSVADILAAARAGKSSAPAVSKPKAEAPTASAPAPAAAVDRSKMSVADMLAAARGGAGAGAVAKAKPAAVPAEAPAAPEAEPAVEPVVEIAPAAKPVGRVDKSKMSIADILAYCREHDAA